MTVNDPRVVIVGVDRHRSRCTKPSSTFALFTEADRAALDYVTELTRDKQVDPGTFRRLARYYSEREICEIVWLVASEHFYNMTNIGLNIHSDMRCDVHKQRKAMHNVEA